MAINIDISAENRKHVAKLLNALLADEFTLYVRTLNYHWNIVSPSFNADHAFLKQQYEELFEVCDTIAERVRALDELSIGTLQEFVALSTLKESNKKLSAHEMYENLLVGYEAIIRTIRVIQRDCMETYHDVGTNNMLLNILEQQEKMAWMVRSTCQQ